tara:strand:- start:894 stop:1073 length:180 start_codon:yes stop_codon:yes gene_type:complete
MKILGYILIVVAIIDFGGSWVGFDLWLQVFGINLTGFLYQFSAVIVGAIGYGLVHAGSK